MEYYSDSTVANPEHLARLKEGVEAFNQWRRNNPEAKPDLREADLCDASFIIVLKEWQELCAATEQRWVFPSPATGRPYHADSLRADCVPLLDSFGHSKHGGPWG